jgi:hypothetical protein
MRTVMLVVALVSLAACEADGPVRAIYSLRSIGGATLPLVVRETPFLEAVSRRFTLYDDGRVTHVATWDTVPGPRSDILTVVRSGTYEFVGQVLEISYSTPEVHYEDWRVVADGLRSQVGAVPEYVYLRESYGLFGP